MSDNYSNSPARADLEQTVACVGQITREFDTMTARLRMDNAEIAVLAEGLRHPDNRSPANPGSVALPATFQEMDQSLARQKALGKELVDAAATFAQELVKWAEELEKREQRRYRPDTGHQIVRDPAGTSVATTVGLLANQAEQWATPVVKEIDTLGSEIGPEASLATEAVVSVPVAALGFFFASGNTAGWEPDVSHSNPQKGWILNPGERRGQDGTIYTSDGQIAVYANGTSALSNEDRKAIALGDGSVSEVSNYNPFLYGLTPMPGSRTTGVDRAKVLEVQLVQATGAGTLDWTPQEVQYIQQTGRLPRGIIGHHINNVAIYPNWAGDPRNVQLVRGQPENLQQHAGNYQNPTTGPLIDRAAIIQQATGEQE